LVDQVLLLFQALFLVLLYLFVWWVVRTASRDLRVPQESFILTAQLAEPSLAPAASTSRRRASQPAGQSFDVGAVPLTIGRTDENRIARGRQYASANHARGRPRDGLWVIDLDSQRNLRERPAHHGRDG
jgi:hypothetical protein